MPSAVEVWFADLPDLPAPRDLALLDPREAATAARFSSPLLAARFIGGRAAVRRVVGEALGIAPAEVPIGRESCPRCGDAAPDDHGRPSVELPGCRLRFSLARAGSLAAVAIADGCDVGVDIEAERPVHLEVLGRHVLSPAENLSIAEAPAHERRTLFFRAWCRKEALTKAAGIGIVTDLRAIETRPRHPGPIRVDLRLDAPSGPDGADRLGGRRSAWQVRDLPAPAGLAAAVAWPFDATRELVVHVSRR